MIDLREFKKLILEIFTEFRIIFGFNESVNNSGINRSESIFIKKQYLIKAFKCNHNIIGLKKGVKNSNFLFLHDSNSEICLHIVYI